MNLKNSIDAIAYQSDMEVINSELLQQVLNARQMYDESIYSAKDIQRILEKDQLTFEDFGAVLSPVAEPFLEDLAQKARYETRKHFGNNIQLFTPLYISNYCENQCLYCGFNCHNQITRTRLTASEIEKEMQAISAQGLEEILILTGESPAMSDLRYIGAACTLARKYFRTIGLEIYPVNSIDYQYLHDCGVDFITVFQETYNPTKYSKLHLKGRKRIFSYRFNAQERALSGGMRGVSFAALLGLDDFRRDALATGLHAYLLQRQYPQAEISFSCPRLRPTTNTQQFSSNHAINERQLLQIICAYRLFLPFAGITISSRESSLFRNHIVNIAATKISAGVAVKVGGHSATSKNDNQFIIEDERSVYEIYTMLQKQGLQPVMSEQIYV